MDKRDYSSFYKEADTGIQPQTLQYEQEGAESILKRLESLLRPVLDKVLGKQKQQTLELNAALDADAYSRGMGKSSLLSQLKSQNATPWPQGRESWKASMPPSCSKA